MKVFWQRVTSTNASGKRKKVWKFQGARVIGGNQDITYSGGRKTISFFSKSHNIYFRGYFFYTAVTVIDRYSRFDFFSYQVPALQVLFPGLAQILNLDGVCIDVTKFNGWKNRLNKQSRKSIYFSQILRKVHDHLNFAHLSLLPEAQGFFPTEYTTHGNAILIKNNCSKCHKFTQQVSMLKWRMLSTRVLLYLNPLWRHSARWN